MILVPVILSGGMGQTLWPLSRELYPKQLLALSGGRTLLQETVIRPEGLAGATAPLIVCSEEARFLVREQLQEIGRSALAIILEPLGRNTAPAITVAAQKVAASGDDALMLVLPADHVINDVASFQKAVRNALPHAAGGEIVLFGVEATRPDTCFGYIRKGAEHGDGLFGVEAFSEKPDHAAAEGYLRDGGYLWNSGIFLVKASAWLEIARTQQPAMAEAVNRAYESAASDGLFLHLDKEAFAASPALSVDNAIMEKIPAGLDREASVAIFNADWHDVGSWPALWELLGKDDAGNVMLGDVFAHDTRNSLLFSGTRLLAAIGMEDVFVVETADAVLVAKKSHAEEVRKVVDWLKGEKRQEHISHQRVFRPWGYYQVIDAGARDQVKRIMVKPGQSLSLQKHLKRAEHWIVVKGTAKVTCGERVFNLAENQSTYIPIGELHRLENPCMEPLEMIEVQSGDYLGEDDIIRVEDKYNRS